MNKQEKKRLLKRIHAGELKSLQEFHNKNPNIHWEKIRYEITGDTVLHVAAKLGNTEILEWLLTNFVPKSIDYRNNDNKTALHEAAQFAQVNAAKLLLNHGANINALKKADWTPLMLACTKLQDRSQSMVNLLIQNGADINYCNKDGWTALHLISREGNLNILKLLLLNGLDAGKLTKNGRSALHIAALHGNIEILNQLQLDINMKDGCGNTPLHEAVLSGQIAITKYLLERGANINAKNHSEYTILHLAASTNALEILNFILSELKFEPNVRAKHGVTALHCAARNNHKEAFDLLVSYGADQDLKDVHGRIPKQYFK